MQQLHLFNDFNKLYFNRNIKKIDKITYKYYHYQVIIEMLPDFDITQVDNIEDILLEYVPWFYDFKIQKYNHKFIIDYYTD